MKKRLFALVCLLVLCCALAADCLAAGQVVRITNRNPVNVRCGPAKKYGSYGSAPSGAVYPYLGEECGWYRIQFTDSLVGYVYNTMAVVEGSSSSSSYDTTSGATSSSSSSSSVSYSDFTSSSFSSFSSSSTEVTESSSYTGMVVRVTHYNALNVRKGPHTSYSAIGSAPSGSAWPYVRTEGGWYVIDFNGREGYLAGNRTELEYVDNADATSGATAECDECGGTGKCDTCNGLGYVLKSGKLKTCPTCDGSRECWACN